MTAQITFTTKSVEAGTNEIILTRATRASKRDGKEIPAAFPAMYATVAIPEKLAGIQDEFVKLAALAGLQAAYQKVIAAKLPTDLLRTAGGAAQTICVSTEDLRSALAAEASEARRITKDAIAEAWKTVVSGALHNLCKQRGVSKESELPDQLRRQVGARLQKRADFLLSLASTTGVQLYSEEQLTAELEWLIVLAEREATEGGWIFAACMAKVVARLDKLREARESADTEEEEIDEAIDLDALF